MAFLATDLIRATARLEFGIPGPDLQNVMYFELISPSSLTDAQVLADIGEVLEIYYTTLLGSMNSQISFVDYAVKNETQDGAPLVALWPTLTVGGSGLEALSNQLVALVVMRTAKSRKSGRVNVGGFTELNLASNIWAAIAITAIGNFITALLTTQVATNGNYRYGVASAGVTPPRTILNSYDAPISGKLITNVRTQRRRSVGFGT